MVLDKVQFVLRGTHTSIDYAMVSIRQDLLRLLKLFGINMRIFTDDYKSVSPEYKVS
jgi:hypothetical protein